MGIVWIPDDIQLMSMVVGLGTMTFRLHDCRSLKAKRRIVKAIINNVDRHFNASVAEIDSNDVHQRAVIGFAMVGNSQRMINSKLDKLLNFTDELGFAEMIDNEMEIMHL